MALTNVDIISLKNTIRKNVMERLDLTRELEDQEVFQTIDEEIFKCSKQGHISIKIKCELRTEVFNSIRKLDILQELLENKEITEIMVNGYKNIFIEKEGRIQPYHKAFDSKERYEDIIQQIVSEANRVVNEANPIVDARLSDGSRVNVVLSPVSVDGPALTIRKFAEERITMERLIAFGSISKEVALFLEQLVLAKYNIFISGGTGSGKTTFLNALSDYIPTDERIITIEDSAELQIKKIPNLVRLEVRNDNVEGKNGITIRDLIKSSLRMRPDRIIVGEVRDAAAIDMLTALNTGHDGSLSTGHANSPNDMISRLESMVLLGTEIPLLAVRRQIASALDLIVHLGRLRDKTRRVLEIVEVLSCENNEVQTRVLYEFKETGVDENGIIIGGLVKTEYELQNCMKLEKAGIWL